MPRLLLSAGAAMIPHPAKQEKGGEDAYFIAEHCLGVADGVGGWAEIGVDPGLYSRQLMQFAKEASTGVNPGGCAWGRLRSGAGLAIGAIAEGLGRGQGKARWQPQ